MITPQIFVGLKPQQQQMIQGGRDYVTANIIINKVCSTLDIDRELLSSSTRKREIVDARTIAIGFITERCPKMTLKAMSKYLGERNHATIIFNQKKFIDLRDSDNRFRRKVELVFKNLP